MSEIDVIIMGRTTYETILGFGIEWPYTKPVYVLSTTLSTVPDHLSGKVHLLSGRPQEVLVQVQTQGYHTIYIDGGRTIQNFLEEDLIDELRITTIPVLLGGGFPLFGALGQPLWFEHVTSKVYLGQLVQDHYRRKRNQEA